MLRLSWNRNCRKKTFLHHFFKKIDKIAAIFDKKHLIYPIGKTYHLVSRSYISIADLSASIGASRDTRYEIRDAIRYDFHQKTLNTNPQTPCFEFHFSVI